MSAITTIPWEMHQAKRAPTPAEGHGWKTSLLYWMNVIS